MLIKAAKESCRDAGLFVMRASLGLFFVFHGAQKLFGAFDGLGLGAYAGLIDNLQLPFPQYVAVLLASIEFFGGLALILGIWSRYAAGLLAVAMLGCGVFVHRSMSAVEIGQITYPANLAYLLLGLAFTLLGMALTGPGRFSLVTLFAIKRVVIPTREPAPSQAPRATA
jgi:putative oxidoreductase